MKKYCLIVKTESYSGITVMVDDDFDEDYDSPVIRKLLRDFPKESRKTILPEHDEVDIINEGEDIKVEPEYYLSNDGVVKTRAYADIKSVLEIPNLIQVQVDSFNWFMTDGLRQLLDEISPIEDFPGGRFELTFQDHYFGKPKNAE